MRGRLALSAALMALAGILEAAGLISLVLLAETLGIDVSAGGATDLSGVNRQLLAWTGLAPSLLTAVTAYVAVTVSQAMVLRAQTVLNLDIEYRFVAFLRTRLYDAIAHAQWLFISRTRGTDFSHALTTELDRTGLATYQLLWSLSTISVMAAQVVIALRISAPLTLLVFGAGGLLAIALFPRLRAAREAGEAISKATNDAHALAIEHLAGMKTVKSQAAERSSTAEFSRLANAVAQRALDAARLQANLRVVFESGAVAILAMLLVVSVKGLALPAASMFVLLFLFARLMPRVSAVQQGLHQYATAVTALVHVEAPRRLVDVAGGHGGFAMAMCRRHPALEATVLDLPPSAAVGRKIVAEEGFADRVSFREGDVFELGLGEDLDVVSVFNLIHHLPEERDIELCRMARAALRPGGVLVIGDSARPEPGDDLSPHGAVSSLLFYAWSHSRNFAPSEVSRWMREAGFEDVEVHRNVRSLWRMVVTGR